MALPTIRSQSAAKWVDGEPRPYSFTLPATVEAGDLLVLFYWNAAQATVPTVGGVFTQAFNAGTSQPQFRCYYKVADGTEGGGAVSINANHNSMSVQVVCFALAGAASHADVAFVKATPTFYDTTNPSTSSVCPSVDATVADSLVIRLCYGLQAPLAAVNGPDSTTEVHYDSVSNGSGCYVQINTQDAAQGVGATGTATFTNFTTNWHKRYADTLVIGSASTAPVVSDVTLSGTSQIGNTLTATAATAPASVDSLAYRWQKAATNDAEPGTDISGETAQTLALSYTDFADLLDSNPASVYVRCGVIATVGAENSAEVFSDWQQVTVASGGGGGTPLGSPCIVGSSMAANLQDLNLTSNGTLKFSFMTTAIGTGVPTTLAGTPSVGVWKNGAKMTLDAAPTLHVDKEDADAGSSAVTGKNWVVIDLSSDADYTAGDYEVQITAGTVDSVSAVGTVVGRFSIENRKVNGFKAGVIDAAAIQADLFATDSELATTVRNAIVGDFNAIPANVVKAAGIPLTATGTPTTTSIPVSDAADLSGTQLTNALILHLPTGATSRITNVTGTAPALTFTISPALPTAPVATEDVVVFGKYLASL